MILRSAKALVDDIAGEYEQVKRMGVIFRTPPTKTPTPTIAVFEDTFGNLIQMYQM